MLELLRRNRDFRTLFIAQIISFAGDWFATVAVLGLVRERSDSDLLATLVFVSQTLPAFFLSPVAGPVADRFDRKTVLVVVSALQVGAAAIFLGAVSGPLVLVFVAQALVSALGAFFGPASQAALPNLVSDEDLPTATALIGATWGTMVAVGSGLGAVFTAAFGRGPAFVADAASFAIAAALIISIRKPMNKLATGPKPRMRPIADTVEGLRFAKRDRTITSLLMTKAGFGLSSGLVGLLAVLADVQFGSKDSGPGIFLAARGIGVVLGPFIARRFIRAGMSRLLLVCGLSALVNGGMYSIAPWMPWLWLSAVFVMAAHLGGGTQWTLSSYGLQVSTPDELRGRIFATDFALVTMTMTLSLIAAGIASDHFGPRPVMLALALLNLTWGAFYLTFTRPLRAISSTRRRSPELTDR